MSEQGSERTFTIKSEFPFADRTVSGDVHALIKSSSSKSRVDYQQWLIGKFLRYFLLTLNKSA